MRNRNSCCLGLRGGGALHEQHYQGPWQSMEVKCGLDHSLYRRCEYTDMDYVELIDW